MNDTDRHWLLVGGVAAFLAFAVGPAALVFLDLHFVAGFLVGVGTPLAFGVVAVGCAVPLMQSRERRAALAVAVSGTLGAAVGALFGFVWTF